MLSPMTTPSPTQQAEAYWVRAHEQVRRGEFAGAVRDLAACFKLLQSVGDPRLPEVHRRWTEVHRMAVEDQASGKPSTPAAAVPSPSIEAEAEAAANAGNLEEAISLYERALAAKPENELVSERLTELKNARPRAAELGVAVEAAPAAERVVEASIVVSDELNDDLQSAVPDSPDQSTIASQPVAPINVAVSVDVGSGAGADDVVITPAVEPMVQAPAIPTEPIPDDDDVAVAYGGPADDAAVGIGVTVEPMVEAPAVPTEPIPDDDDVAVASGSPADEAAVSVAAPADAVVADDRALSTGEHVDVSVSAGVAVEPMVQAPASAIEPIDDAFGDLSDVEAPSNVAPAGLVMDDGDLSEVRGEVTDGDGALGIVGASDDDFAVQDDDDGEDDIHSRPTVILGPAASDGDASSGGDALDVHKRPTSDLNIDDFRAEEAEDAATTSTVSATTATATTLVSAPTPAPQAAPPMMAEDAPVGMKSLDVDIDMGDSIGADEADELPVAMVEIGSDDIMEVGDDMQLEELPPSLPPQPAPTEASVSAAPAPELSTPPTSTTPSSSMTATGSLGDDLSDDPVEMLNSLLVRIAQNRRAA